MEIRTASCAAVSEVLNVNNYLVWKVQVRTYLIAQDLWDIVEATDECPNQEDDEAASKKEDDEAASKQEDDEAASKAWTRKNAMALHVIQFSCEPCVCFVIRRISSAKIAWDTLKAICKIDKSDYAVTRPRLDRFYLDQIDKVRAFPRRSFHELVTFSSLATWGLGPEPSAENLSHEETTRKRILTMRENREKTVTSGDEDANVPPVVQKAAVQMGKRKSKKISSVVDLDDLPSRRGPKKPKTTQTPLPKVPKFTPQTVNLDESSVNVEPVQIIHPVSADPVPLPTKTPRKPHSAKPSDRPSNLVLDENYAWRTFKGLITDNEINECYNMSVKEFERSGIHDLFKAMSKFYTATCQAKELAEEAKSAKEKTEELNKEVLLKKGEVIRLKDDFNRLLASETKLKNEVEELKADSVEKDTRIAYLKGQASEFASSLEKAREEAIAAFKKSDEYKNRLDSHYAASYEDFRADAKEAFPELNFDSFKLPLATESSVLATSSEDVNVVDDASNEVTQDDPKTNPPK